MTPELKWAGEDMVQDVTPHWESQRLHHLRNLDGLIQTGAK